MHMIEKLFHKNALLHFFFLFFTNVLIFNHSFIIERNLKKKNINELEMLFNSKRLSMNSNCLFYEK